MLDIYVLGAAAGGGFPQWNCACEACQRARNGDPHAQRRSQASITVSADRHSWYILNASPDIRQQIQQTPVLWPDPKGPLRNTPIKGVILTNAEIDAIAGLLTMRERQAFQLFATSKSLRQIEENPLFAALDPALVKREALYDGTAYRPDSSSLYIRPFFVPGKCPLYAEDPQDPAQIHADGGNIALEISDGASRVIFIPNCAHVTPQMKERMDGADLLFFDGTLWKDEEMIETGLSHKTGQRMGHMSIAQKGIGTFDTLAPLKIGRKVFIHINNSNPILLDDSSEYRETRAKGWEVSYDGMHITL